MSSRRSMIPFSESSASAAVASHVVASSSIAATIAIAGGAASIVEAAAVADAAATTAAAAAASGSRAVLGPPEYSSSGAVCSCAAQAAAELQSGAQVAPGLQGGAVTASALPLLVLLLSESLLGLARSAAAAASSLDVHWASGSVAGGGGTLGPRIATTTRRCAGRLGAFTSVLLATEAALLVELPRLRGGFSGLVSAAA